MRYQIDSGWNAHIIQIATPGQCLWFKWCIIFFNTYGVVLAKATGILVSSSSKGVDLLAYTKSLNPTENKLIFEANYCAHRKSIDIALYRRSLTVTVVPFSFRKKEVADDDELVARQPLDPVIPDSNPLLNLFVFVSLKPKSKLVPAVLWTAPSC